METCAGYIQAQCPVSMYLKMYSINLQVQFTSSMYWFNVADLSGLLSIMLRVAEILRREATSGSAFEILLTASAHAATCFSA